MYIPSKRKFRFPLLLGLLLIAGILSGGAKNEKRNFEISKGLDLFNAVFKELDLFYVDTVPAEKSITTGIQAMLSTLDPYTVYIPESKTEEFKTMTTGEYGGIGAIIMQRDSAVYISEPYRDMPAQLAGLRAGDKLVAIDTIRLAGKNTAQVSELLKGPARTKFTLTFERPGTEGLQTREIVRKKIVIPPVPYYGVTADSLGYIYLSSFTENAAKAVRKAVQELKKTPGLKGYVLDLRENPGGILEDAIEIVNLFVPKGKEVLSTRGKVKQWDKTYKTTQEPVDTQTPLVVLINSGSASASEIVAGALQDLDRAVVVGTRSYGKGLVQTTRSLPYNGLLKVTTAKYYIPSGRLIQSIDYSHRNPDGSAGRVPDDKRQAFRTANGRTVYDGGGIQPDLEVEEQHGNIEFYLLNDFLVFDFATQYVNTHPTIAPVDSFELTDADFADFKAFVKSKNFSYDRQSEKMLESLKETAAFEGYLEKDAPEFQALEAKLQHNLDRELDRFRPAVEAMIRTELAKRYYFQAGEIAAALKRDTVLQQASAVLKDPARYRAVLTPRPEKK